MKILSSLAIAAMAILSGCGGGDSSTVATPPAVTVASLNVADTFKKMSTTTQSWFPLTRSDGSKMYAGLSIYDAESYPFVINGVPKATATSRVVGLLISNADGTAAQKWRWKMHFDDMANPIGISYSDFSVRDCFAPTTVNTLPTSSNANGVVMSGLLSSDYSERFNAGRYTQYCNTTTSSRAAAVEWSVVEGSPKPYFCLIFPESVWLPKTRVCLMPDGSGGFSNSAWVTLLGSGSTSSRDVDYKTSP